MEQTHYQVLGVEPTASAEEIKRRFRELARKYHPDVCPDKLASHQMFVRITEAYQVLSDATRRADYDLTLRDRSQRQASVRAATGASRPPGDSRTPPGSARSAPPPRAGARPGPNPPPHVGFRVGLAGGGAGPRARATAGRPRTTATTHPTQVAQHLRTAQAAFVGLRYRDAVRHCKQALELDPRNGAACGLLGDIYRAQGRVDDAIYFYSLAAQLTPPPQNRAVMAKLEALLAQEPSAPGRWGARSPEATLAAGAARIRRRLNRQICIGAFGIALAVGVLFLAVQAPGERLTELPWISAWTAPIVWAMVLVGGIVGATLTLAGALRPMDEELFFVLVSRAGGSATPLGLLLLVTGGLFFYAAVGLYLLIGALQESFSRSLLRVFVATFLIVCCLALLVSPDVGLGRQILLFGGNVVFLSMLLGWLLGDFFRPLGS